MMLNRRHLLGALGGGLATLAARPVWAIPAEGARPALLPRALAALDTHRARVIEPGLIALVDFGLHSSDQRLQLVDVLNGRVLESHLVAHGRGSDPFNSGWVQRFSNRHGSNASSSGAFLTGEIYHGRHGRARRLDGLDADNDQARERGIVIHAAGYVDPAFVARQGRIGRSEGCFALSWAALDGVLERLGPGHLLFATK
ncbi:MAG: murein L,D-transpeptidase catalytic domain family protein [Proteobacteria bacterium]|nr:murein L,D-transpeptidase catalytic domain family protein [Pseudomonadota bacterium]